MLTKVRGLKKEAMSRYALTDDDYYIHVEEDGSERIILNRQGIDKVGKKVLMTMRIESIQTVPYGSGVCTTIVATGRVGDLTEQRIASANPDNCKWPNYGEVAEKRVRHRLLLTLADLYQFGIHSDSESDTWKKSQNDYSGVVSNVEESLKKGKGLLNVGKALNKKVE